jgi:hypothetical protein
MRRYAWNCASCAAAPVSRAPRSPGRPRSPDPAAPWRHATHATLTDERFAFSGGRRLHELSPQHGQPARGTSAGCLRPRRFGGPEAALVRCNAGLGGTVLADGQYEEAAFTYYHLA